MGTTGTTKSFEQEGTKSAEEEERSKKLVIDFQMHFPSALLAISC